MNLDLTGVEILDPETAPFKDQAITAYLEKTGRRVSSASSP